jgi:hypothetical protein
MTWGIKIGWKYEAVEIVKETDKTVRYVDRYWGKPRETRIDKDKILPWRGDEETARAIVDKMTSARAEYERRRKSASDWFDRRRAEILASAGEAGTAKTEGLGPKDERAAPEGGDAQ